MRGGLSIANALNRSIKVYVWGISLATYNLAVYKISNFKLHHHRITILLMNHLTIHPKHKIRQMIW